MKTLLHYSPLAFFFIAFRLYDIYVATAVLMVSVVIVTVADYVMTRKINRSLLLYSAIALVMGSATLYFHNANFIKFKPSLIYGALAIALLGSHWIGDRVLLQKMAGETLTLPETLWRKINLAWVGFFIFCAVLNAYVAMNYSEATWVQFKLIAFTALPFVFALAHAPVLMRYLPEETTAGEAKSESNPKAPDAEQR